MFHVLGVPLRVVRRHDGAHGVPQQANPRVIPELRASPRVQAVHQVLDRLRLVGRRERARGAPAHPRAAPIHEVDAPERRPPCEAGVEAPGAALPETVHAHQIHATGVRLVHRDASHDVRGVGARGRHRVDERVSADPTESGVPKQVIKELALVLQAPRARVPQPGP